MSTAHVIKFFHFPNFAMSCSRQITNHMITKVTKKQVTGYIILFFKAASIIGWQTYDLLLGLAF